MFVCFIVCSCNRRELFYRVLGPYPKHAGLISSVIKYREWKGKEKKDDGVDEQQGLGN